MRGEEEEEECHQGVVEVRICLGCGVPEKRKELFVAAAELGLKDQGGQHQGLGEGTEGEGGGWVGVRGA